jgi:hypothetical protein
MWSYIRTAGLTGIAVIATVWAVAGFASGASVQKVQTIHVITGAQHLESFDAPPLGASPGDVYVFDAPVLSPKTKRVIGRIRGTQTSIKREHGVLTVQGMLTYELGAGNEIVIGGLASYPLNAAGLIRGKTFVRAVLGGTGRYAGASGTLTSKQVAPGRYDQVFRLTY